MLTGCLCPLVADVTADAPLNIIFVLTDDQGYGDLGCHGHPFLKTPNIDELYSQSTRFTDFQASPTCAPTRAALMSGRAPFKSGVAHTIYERERMALSATTIAEVLQGAGYTTGIFGMVNLSPDTSLKRMWNSGCRYHDKTTYGMTHTRCWQPLQKATESTCRRNNSCRGAIES